MNRFISKILVLAAFCMIVIFINFEGKITLKCKYINEKPIETKRVVNGSLFDELFPDEN